MPAAMQDIADAWVFSETDAASRPPQTGYPHLSIAGDEALTVAFSGTLFDQDALRGSDGLDREQPMEPAAVVLRAYTQLGERWLHALRGHYAIVIVDRRRRRTIAVRDAMGLHPLFVARGVDGLLFSWSTDALLAQPGVSRD